MNSCFYFGSSTTSALWRWELVKDPRILEWQHRPWYLNTDAHCAAGAKRDAHRDVEEQMLTELQESPASPSTLCSPEIVLTPPGTLSPLNIFPFLNDLASWRPSISMTHNKNKVKEGSCLSTKSQVSLPGYFKQMFNTGSCFMSAENSACCYSRMQ